MQKNMLLNHTIYINKDIANQRIDNFLFKKFKNIPKSVIYKGLRTKKIKVNQKKKNILIN